MTEEPSGCPWRSLASYPAPWVALGILMTATVPVYVRQVLHVDARAVGLLQVLIYTVLQTETPAELRGRVFLAVAGPLLDRFGAAPLVWGAALSSKTIRQA